MRTLMDHNALVELVRELCNLTRETEWVEFKVNNQDPQKIGEYISALANAATLRGETNAYVVWGIENASHEIVGTRFSPLGAKFGAEPLETWLARLLRPRIDFSFEELDVGGRPVVLLRIESATHQPIAFKGEEYIRIGSSTRKLRDFPSKERALWRAFERTNFVDLFAAERLGSDEVLQLLDYPAYFELVKLPLPDGRNAILNALIAERLATANSNTSYNITNLGAVLFAKNLRDFSRLSRKAVRVIQYRGNDRTMTLREHVNYKGYACGFTGLVDHIDSLLPINEYIEQALRRSAPMFPELAIRELVANAVIHQDFLVRGAGPTVEIFDDRIEITNPGKPIVETDRFLDSPPKSRNEELASLMRRFGICEERGSGIDKVVVEVELYQLPAPLFETPPESTRVVLFAYKALADMNLDERVRACYFHACLKCVTRDYLTNASLRGRFGIKQSNSSIASRRIREAIDVGAIKPFDQNAPRKLMKYQPYWA